MKRILYLAVFLLASHVGHAQTDMPPVPGGAYSPPTHSGLEAARAANPLTSDYKATVKTTTATLQANPKDVAALQQRGLAYLRLKEYVKALEDYNKLVSLKAATPDDYINRAEVQLNLSEHSAAISDLNVALRLRPGDPRATLARGISRLYNNDLRNAITDFTRVISPPDPNAPPPPPKAAPPRRGVKMAPRPTAKPAPTPKPTTAPADGTATAEVAPPPPPQAATPEQLAQAYKYRGAAYVATKKIKQGCEDLHKAQEMLPNDSDVKEEIRRNCQ